jgi:hypothetical protein
MYRSGHLRMHMMGNEHGIGNKGKKRKSVKRRKKDISNRQCFDCLLSRTSKNKDGTSRWYIYQHIFLCRNCYCKRIRRIPNYIL